MFLDGIDKKFDLIIDQLGIIINRLDILGHDLQSQRKDSTRKLRDIDSETQQIKTRLTASRRRELKGFKK